jgi:RNA polymerase sigma-70 factor (ECF subfamily)
MMTTILPMPTATHEGPWGAAMGAKSVSAAQVGEKKAGNEGTRERMPEPVDAAEDLQLVRAAADGDARAFERLYRLHIDHIYGLCYRLCGGDALRADQAAQDAFVRAWERLSSFRGEARFGTWLHRLTVNVVLGEHRQLRRWVSFEESTVVELAAPEGGALTNEDNERYVHDRDVGRRMDLERALARLPKGARAVMVLHDVEGYPHEEIAALTGIAVGTSKAQLHRARRLLKEWLQ